VLTWGTQINTKYGYFLDQPVGDFDAEFFGVSGKEAEAMDPQQRLLLEVTYEALEEAGIPINDIRGSRTSVFCGMYTTSNDYHNLQAKDLEYYPKYAITGTGNSILSNRISYIFDLHGPSMTVDTGCSSSLVAFHLGCESLHNGEADISIIVGSALHFGPNTYQTMSDMGFISSDGRCRSFDADGSGYVRGDGICAVVLKKGHAAFEAGDRIHAVVRGTGVNHDGRTDGITLPSPAAQEALIRATYAHAGVDPDDTGYFEAHGTGTKAGDPREAAAIGAVFGTHSRARPLYMGSVKSNIGHLEGAAGLAGIIKATLALKHAKIPPNMHFNTPNPDIPFKKWKLEVPTAAREWVALEGKPRRASINSFGYGGANAHVILEQAPDSHASVASGIRESSTRPYLLPVTSHSQQAGERAIKNLGSYLQSQAEPTTTIIRDLAHSLGTRRSLHMHRAYVVVHSGVTSANLASELLDAASTRTWMEPEIPNASVRVGFVFTGQGAQKFDMGRELIQHSPRFRATLQLCDNALQALPDKSGWSIIDELLCSPDDSRISQSRYSQPICTAVQLALVDLLADWGIRPSSVCGHSSGEIAAAYAAGVLTLEAAIVVAFYRGLHMASGMGAKPGAMMAVGLSEADAKAQLVAYIGRLVVAAINSPSSVTISGDADAILELQEQLVAQGVFARKLKVDLAFHSHHMLPMAPAYQHALEASGLVIARSAACRLFSSVTARLVNSPSLEPAYWASNMVRPVRFSDALVGAVLDENESPTVDVLLEVGPHPALEAPSRDVLKVLGMDNMPYVGTLFRNHPAYESLLSTAGELFGLGYPVNFSAVNGLGNRLDDLPTYAWNHKNYWSLTRLTKEHLARPSRHTLLGVPVPGAIHHIPRWRNYIRLHEIPWLRDHCVDGKVVFPAAGYCCMAIEAAIRLRDGKERIVAIHLKEVLIRAPLALREDNDEGVETLLELRPVTESARTFSEDWHEFSVSSFDETGRETRHCHGRISIEYGTPRGLKSLSKVDSAESLINRSDRYMTASALYGRLDALDLHYGPYFALLKGDIASGPGFSVCSFSFDPSIFSAYELEERTVLHPTLLDSTFHVLFSAIETRLGRQITDAFVSTYMATLDISGILVEQGGKPDVKEYTVQTHTDMPGQRTAVNHILLHQADTGDLIVEATGNEVTALGTNNSRARALFFRQRWRPCFDLLNGKEVKGLEELIGLYVFQHPTSRILLVLGGSSPSETLLSRLIVPITGCRLYETLHILAPNQELIANDSNGLTWVSEAQGAYDLVILDKGEEDISALNGTPATLDETPPTSDRTPLIPNGTFLASIPVLNGTPATSNGTYALPNSRSAAWDSTAPALVGGIPFSAIQHAFAKETVLIAQSDLQGEHERIASASGWMAYRAPSALQPTSFTIVLPSDPSIRTQTILAKFKAQQHVKSVITTTLDLIPNNKINTEYVVVLATLDAPSIDTAALWAGTRHLLALEDTSIIWVVNGATMSATSPEGAKILGLLRVARNENHASRLISLDMESSSPAELIAERILSVLGLSGEEEFADRAGRLYIPRIEEDASLNRKLPDGVGSEPRLSRFGDHASLQLRVGTVGLLETLHFASHDSRLDEPLGEDEVEVRVKASAINFHDLAVALGIIQDYNMGNECAGVVERIGAGVADLVLGDRVVAYRPGQGAHGTLTRQPRGMCLKIPDDMSFALAASLPVTLTTAYYSLFTLGRLRQGETVLIHSGAGGVGQVAIQMAKSAGARVLVTCSEGKRALLKEKYGLSDAQIFSSRDDSFQRAVMDATNGKGVDVALNSLAGKLLHSTWACVAPFGRFIEIGKRDIHQNSNLGMGQFRKNVIFASVDMILVYELDPALAAELLQETFRMVISGEVSPPEGLFEFSYGSAERAFRLMQLGRHTGKIVLGVDENEKVMVAPPTYHQTQLFRPDKTYLLVGGLGGLGTATAEWMYLRGARKFAFMSRSGANKDYSRKTVEWLKSKSSQVDIYLGDVAVLDDVKDVVRRIGASLAGIFHIAVVLQDGMIGSLSFEQYQTGLRTKCCGAWNLHEATLGYNLDFFVCWSSVSAICGNKGQGAYVAANAYMDALMRWRREQGLVGTAMNLGAVPERGLVAENEHVRKSLERNKLDVLTEQELMFLVEEAVLLDRPAVEKDNEGLDWHQLIVGVNTKQPDVWWRERSLFRALYANRAYGTSVANSGKAGQAASTGSRLAAAKTAEEKVAILQQDFIQKVATVLGTPPESIVCTNPLSFYGLDSIVAVEFRKWFKEAVDADLSAFDILGAKSIRGLVEKVSALIVSTEAPSKERTKTAQVDKAAVADEPARDFRRSMPSTRIPSAKNLGPAKMSTFEMRMFNRHLRAEDKALMNLTGVLRLAGRPALLALEESFNETVRRHGVLSTAFFQDSENLMRSPQPIPKLRLAIQNFSSTTDPEAELQQVISRLRGQVLNIAEGEVATMTLVKTSQAEYSLVFIAHHVCFDRRSFVILMDDWMDVYDAIRSGRGVATVPFPPITYADFAGWHNALLYSPQALAHLDFWAQNLSGIRPEGKLLPFAKRQRSSMWLMGRHFSRATLPGTYSKRLKRICAQLSVTPFHFLLAAWRMYLFQHTRDEDFVILMMDGNCPHADAEAVIGCMANLLPLRFRATSDATSFEDVVRSTRDVTLEALAHATVSFDDIADRVLGEKRPTGFMPLGQIAVNYQMHGAPWSYKHADFELKVQEVHNIGHPSDLLLEVVGAAKGEHEFIVRYSTALYKPEDMGRFATNFARFVAGMVTDHRQAVGEVLADGER